MQRYSDYFKTLHDETNPTGYLGRGTHYSVLRAVIFHDPLGKSLPRGEFLDFAVIWDEDHDVRVIEPIEELYLRGLLPGFVMFGERKGHFTGVLSNKIAAEIKAAPFNTALLRKVDELPLSVRSANCFSNDNIIYVGDLVQKFEAEMLRIPNFGRKALNEVKEVLVEMGLHLGMDVPEWPPENAENLLKHKTRLSFLKAEIKLICQSLDDPWNSGVVTLGGEDNGIISDEDEKVRLYLRNLEMLWRLGSPTKEQSQRSMPAQNMSSERPQVGMHGARAGYVIDLSESK